MTQTILNDHLFESLREKLNPNRFPDMAPSFAQLVRAIMEPRKAGLYIDADGIIFDAEEGFWGSRQWLIESWEELINLPEAGLTAEEHKEARLHFKCYLIYLRHEAPDKKPYGEKLANTISLALQVTDNPQEVANLVAEIMFPKDRKAQDN
jgi:hypothetical protein